MRWGVAQCVVHPGCRSEGAEGGLHGARRSNGHLQLPAPRPKCTISHPGTTHPHPGPTEPSFDHPGAGREVPEGGIQEPRRNEGPLQVPGPRPKCTLSHRHPKPSPLLIDRGGVRQCGQASFPPARNCACPRCRERLAVKGERSESRGTSDAEGALYSETRHRTLHATRAPRTPRKTEPSADHVPL